MKKGRYETDRFAGKTRRKQSMFMKIVLETIRH